MEPEELAAELASEAASRNVLVEAYPGWGKTRLAAMLASLARSAAVVTRTHEEVYEVMRFNGDLTPLFGKEKLCLLWRRGEDVSVYRFCERARLLGTCRYTYRASHQLVRWIAGRKPARPEEIVERAMQLNVCPYPSVLALSKARRVVTTYGFAFSFREVLWGRELVVYDESHEMLNVMASLVERVDEAYVNALATTLKRDAGSRMLAYFVRTCWRKARDFREFVEALERAPADHELVDRIVDAFRSGRAWWSGKEGYLLPSKPEIPGSGQVYLTAYLPPFMAGLIPNLRVIRVPSENRITVILDRDLSSRYEERSEETYKAYAGKVEDYYVANAANLVVFPSYEFMERVKRYLPQYILDRVKPPEAVREAGDGDVVFDVAGGRATEGVNPSPRLRRVIVVGLPYPQPAGELNLLARLYGFDSVYTYLALLRVVQSVGRLRFRWDADAVLIDRRYEAVKGFFPAYFDLSG